MEKDAGMISLKVWKAGKFQQVVYSLPLFTMIKIPLILSNLRER